MTNFTGTPLISGTYNFVVTAFNWVGQSSQSPALTVTLPLKVSPTLSIVSGGGIISAQAGVDADV